MRTWQPVRTGDYVLVRARSAPARQATALGLVPSGTPLVKRVAAADGDRVCWTPQEVQINGHPAAPLLPRSAQGLPPLAGCLRLGAGQLLLLQDHPRSFDSRYFGPAPATAVAGRLVRLAVPFGTAGDRR